MLNVKTKIYNHVYLKHPDGSLISFRVESFRPSSEEVEFSFNSDPNNIFQVKTKERMEEPQPALISVERIIFGGVRRIWANGSIYSTWYLSNDRVITVIRKSTLAYRIIYIHEPTNFRIEVNSATRAKAFVKLRHRLFMMSQLIKDINL